MTDEAFSKFEQMVVRELDRNNSDHDEIKAVLEKLDDKVDTLKLDNHEVKIKGSLWGAVAATVITLGSVLANHFIK